MKGGDNQDVFKNHQRRQTEGRKPRHLVFQDQLDKQNVVIENGYKQAEPHDMNPRKGWKLVFGKKAQTCNMNIHMLKKTIAHGIANPSQGCHQIEKQTHLNRNNQERVFQDMMAHRIKP